jgi:uncharacterized protein (TIGR02271 family)
VREDSDRKDYPSRSSAGVLGLTDQRRRSEYHQQDRGWGEGLDAAVRGTSGEDEVRVQRVEEELRAGTREREAGAMKVRKRVRAERARVRVPIRREKVRVERVAVERRRATKAEIGEDEFVVPFVEEEVVVEKRPVAKEEIRLRKEVVQDEEVVERDVCKEEVDIDDQTERGVRHGGRRCGEHRDERS